MLVNETSNGRIVIRLFGDLSLTFPDATGLPPVTRFPTHKTAALLALLALSPGRSVTRDVLVDRLWTDAPIEDGRRSLRVALSALRRLLEPPGTPVGAVLIATRDSVSLCADAVTTDVAAFDAAVRRGDAEAATRLHSTGTFLAAFYDDWVMGERDRLDAAYEKVRAAPGRVAVAELPPVPPQEPPRRDPRERLPLYLTRYIGRETERETFAALLTDGTNRLLTVTGTGGVGKTRFVREVLGNLPGDRVTRYVPLADAPDVPAMVRRVAEAFGLDPAKADANAVSYVLHDAGDVRLCLDNMEQLLSTDATTTTLAAWLAACPALQIIATSRQKLNLPGEIEIALEPLATPTLPATPERLLDFAAVRLFCDRARLARPDAVLTPRNADTIAALCDRLGGLPLTLEITASWAGVLTFSQMLARVEAHLLDETGTPTAHTKAGRPERHRTLRAALDVSLSLLSPSLAEAFTHLAVFAGGFTADAAHAVLGADAGSPETLTRLRERSLLAVDTDENTETMRFRLLPAIHEYARERFDAPAVAAAHGTYYLALAEAPRTDEAALDADFGNLCAALDHAATVPDDAELRFCVALLPFFRARGHNRAGLSFVERALSRANGGTELYRRAVVCAGNLAYDTCAFERSRMYHQTALALAEAADDARVWGSALQGIAAIVLYVDADCAGALALCERAREQFRRIEGASHEARLLLSMTTVVEMMGDEAGAFGHCRDALALARQIGDAPLEAHAHQRLGGLLHAYCNAPDTHDARLAEAESELNTSLALYERLGNRIGIATATTERASVAWERSDYDAAITGYEAALAVYKGSGDTWSAALVLSNLGRLSGERGDFARAATYLNESLTYRVRLDDKHAQLQCVDAGINLLVAMAVAPDKPFRRDLAREAVRLRAADRTLRGAFGFGASRPDDLRETEDTFAVRLGKAEFDRAETEGAALTLDAAINTVRVMLAKVR